MRKITFGLITLIAVAGLFSCNTSFEDIKYSDGQANLSTYVAIGGGYTAGYCDSALYLEAQRNSYPAILASRFALADGGSFNQPLVNEGVGIGVNGNARYKFDYISDNCGTGKFIKAVPVSPTGDITNFLSIGGAPIYNNMGVPGARAKDLNKQTFGDPSPFVGNPFYARFASAPGVSTVAGDAIAQAPTFYTLWMGTEDVFGYARRGGKESGDSISDVNKFKADMQKMIDNLKAVGSKGVLANLPPLNAMPFFTATNIKGLMLTAGAADTLNNLYAPINPDIHFQAGANYYVFNDANAPGGRRQLKDGEYILLTVPVDSIRCFSLGQLVPIPGRHVLDMTEIALVNTAVADYNAAIAQLGVANQIAVADMYQLFSQIRTSILFGGTHYGSEYPLGGFYSTDGYYPTPRGYALIANQFIETINTAFQARLPYADANAYPGIKFP